MAAERPPGYVKAYRIPEDHPLRVLWGPWGLGCWIELVQRANWRDGKTLQRGQLFATVRTLSDDWRASRDTTHRFLRFLEMQQMIVWAKAKSRRFPSVITVCNYEKWQGNGASPPDGDRTVAERLPNDRQDTSVEGKKGRNISVGSADPTAREVLTYWRDTYHSKAELTDERLRKVRGRLKKKQAPDLRKLIDYVCRDPWWCGENDRHTDFSFPEHFMKNDTQVDRLLEQATSGRPAQREGYGWT